MIRHILALAAFTTTAMPAAAQTNVQGAPTISQTSVRHGSVREERRLFRAALYESVRAMDANAQLTGIHIAMPRQSARRVCEAFSKAAYGRVTIEQRLVGLGSIAVAMVANPLYSQIIAADAFRLKDPQDRRILAHCADIRHSDAAMVAIS